MSDRPVVTFEDLGRRPYLRALEHQMVLRDALVARKRNRPPVLAGNAPHKLLFVEHDPIYTLGKSGKLDHLLLDPDQLAASGIDFAKTNRGGDITYHGPGQLVGYPILDLDEFFHDIRRYIWSLEEAVIRLLATYELHAERYEGFTGVWLPPEGMLPWRKICAIGVHLSRWVTSHGFALNVDPDLSHFRGIVPCGITGGTHEVTSLALELEGAPGLQELKSRLRTQLAEVLEFDYAVVTDRSSLSSWSSPVGSRA